MLTEVVYYILSKYLRRHVWRELEIQRDAVREKY